jgi:hypothetical protein
MCFLIHFNECERQQDRSTLFSYLESLKRAQRELEGVIFSYDLYESEKVINVYSITFSGIYEHEKEQRLSSGLFLLKLKTKQNYAWDRFYFYTSLKLKKTILGPSFIFTHA